MHVEPSVATGMGEQNKATELGLEAGALTGSGEDIARPDTVRGAWVALKTGGWFGLHLGGPLWARLELAVLFPFVCATTSSSTRAAACIARASQSRVGVSG